MVPLWVAVHLWGSIIRETALFLVPLIMVLIPLTLLGMQRQEREPRDHVEPPQSRNGTQPEPGLRTPATLVGARPSR